MSVRAQQVEMLDAQSDDNPRVAEDDEPPIPSGENKKVTYLALEGVDPSEVSTADKASIENQIAELLLLNFDVPLEKVRLITSDTNVVEVIESDNF